MKKMRVSRKELGPQSFLHLPRIKASHCCRLLQPWGVGVTRQVESCWQCTDFLVRGRQVRQCAQPLPVLLSAVKMLKEVTIKVVTVSWTGKTSLKRLWLSCQEMAWGTAPQVISRHCTWPDIPGERGKCPPVWN